ncbi:MAG TPA: hypothetical protein VL912_10545, partial [Candidatus Udaeobacter sp.]|nr:hypothetical protein [Candidatus Udaeobacter sp.]
TPLQLGRKCLLGITALLLHAERNETESRFGSCSLLFSFSTTSGRLWFLLGIEKLRVIKGFTAGSMLDSYFHPYSHSLITAILWSVVAALIYKAICGRHSTRSAPLIIGLAVFSHWVLDLIAHPRDLAIYDNTWKVGFGLWNYRDPEFALEIALLAAGIALYLARNAMPAVRKGAVIAFGIVLVIVQIGDTYVPRTPLTDKATVMGVWIFYTLFVFIAFVVEKIGSRRKIDGP